MVKGWKPNTVCSSTKCSGRICSRWPYSSQLSTLTLSWLASSLSKGRNGDSSTPRMTPGKRRQQGCTAKPSRLAGPRRCRMMDRSLSLNVGSVPAGGTRGSFGRRPCAGCRPVEKGREPRLIDAKDDARKAQVAEGPREAQPVGRAAPLPDDGQVAFAERVVTDQVILFVRQRHQNFALGGGGGRKAGGGGAS